MDSSISKPFKPIYEYENDLHRHSNYQQWKTHIEKVSSSNPSIVLIRQPIQSIKPTKLLSNRSTLATTTIFSNAFISTPNITNKQFQQMNSLQTCQINPTRLQRMYNLHMQSWTHSIQSIEGSIQMDRSGTFHMNPIPGLDISMEFQFILSHQNPSDSPILSMDSSTCSIHLPFRPFNPHTFLRNLSLNVKSPYFSKRITLLPIVWQDTYILPTQFNACECRICNLRQHFLQWIYQYFLNNSNELLKFFSSKSYLFDLTSTHRLFSNFSLKDLNANPFLPMTSTSSYDTHPTLSYSFLQSNLPKYVQTLSSHDLLSLLDHSSTDETIGTPHRIHRMSTDNFTQYICLSSTTFGSSHPLHAMIESMLSESESFLTSFIYNAGQLSIEWYKFRADRIHSVHNGSLSTDQFDILMEELQERNVPVLCGVQHPGDLMMLQRKSLERYWVRIQPADDVNLAMNVLHEWSIFPPTVENLQSAIRFVKKQTSSKTTTFPLNSLIRTLLHDIVRVGSYKAINNPPQVTKHPSLSKTKCYGRSDSQYKRSKLSPDVLRTIELDENLLKILFLQFYRSIVEYKILLKYSHHCIPSQHTGTNPKNISNDELNGCTRCKKELHFGSFITCGSSDSLCLRCGLQTCTQSDHFHRFPLEYDSDELELEMMPFPSHVPVSISYPDETTMRINLFSVIDEPLEYFFHSSTSKEDPLIEMFSAEDLLKQQSFAQDWIEIGNLSIDEMTYWVDCDTIETQSNEKEWRSLDTGSFPLHHCQWSDTSRFLLHDLEARNSFDISQWIVKIPTMASWKKCGKCLQASRKCCRRPSSESLPVIDEIRWGCYQLNQSRDRPVDTETIDAILNRLNHACVQRSKVVQSDPVIEKKAPIHFGQALRRYGMICHSQTCSLSVGVSARDIQTLLDFVIQRIQRHHSNGMDDFWIRMKLIDSVVEKNLIDVLNLK